MSDRMRRVNEALRQVLSEAMPTLKDPRIGFVTVTGVDTTTDLEHATVWVSVLGSERDRENTLAALAGTPQLTFAYDPSVERGVRMSHLIDELAPTGDDDDGA